MNTETKNESPLHCPQIETVLNSVIKAHKLAGGRKARHMPESSIDAAAWWIDMQEPPRESENATKLEKGWRTPYHDRMVYTLRKFLCAEPKLQDLIFAAREDGIFWRGDDFDFILCVISEHERMKAIGMQAYKAEARTKARRHIQSTTHSAK